ncbi:MAG TPA: serine hydrolase domain-containing protein [Solirubrobacteraceae bacterium]|nr:serine hydrolase domain-containing protein [Solirubrobacteraceae bacterium]
MSASEIDALFQRAVDDGVLPGVVAVAGDRDGERYEGAFGLLNVEGGASVQPDTVFAIASMTKAITSVAALQLMERGQLELQQPVADVLPKFAELQVLEGFDGEQPRLRAPRTQATIRHLLTHTSGLGYWFSNADLLRYHQFSGIPDPTSGRLAMLDMPLAADPGTRWEYGTSTDWLGQVIEAVSGEELGAYCQANVFGPLAMSDATFRPSEEQAARVMAMHSRTPDGGLVQVSLDFPEPEFASGAGGAYATAPDYLRFMRALLRGGELDGERVLQAETVALAFSDHLDGVPLPEVVRSAVPELTNDVLSLPVAQGFGLGFHIVLEDMPGMRRAGSGDWAGLFNCYYWIDGASGLAGAVLTQVLPFFDARIVETAAAFEQLVYAQPSAAQPGDASAAHAAPTT